MKSPPDYRAVVTALRDGLQRFATGTYAVWYPLLQRRESLQLADSLRQEAGPDWVDIALAASRHWHRAAMGMHGSGMFIVNPPWKFTQAMRDIMPWLTKTLAQDASATFQLSSRET